MLITILDLSEGYDVHKAGEAFHHVTIEAPAPADGLLTLNVLKNEASGKNHQRFGVKF